MDKKGKTRTGTLVEIISASRAVGVRREGGRFEEQLGP